MEIFLRLTCPRIIVSNFVLFKIIPQQHQENNQRSDERVQRGQPKVIHANGDEKPGYDNELMKK